MLYIIVIYASSQNGLVFYINQKVLGIRYFQRSCASYYHHIWVISTYRISIWSCIYVYMISSIKKHIWKMVLYICIYDIINRKTYLKTLYLIPNTFKEWAENLSWATYISWASQSSVCYSSCPNMCYPILPQSCRFWSK